MRGLGNTMGIYELPLVEVSGENLLRPSHNRLPAAKPCRDHA